MGAAARALAQERYSWDAIAARLVEIYGEVASRARSMKLRGRHGFPRRRRGRALARPAARRRRRRSLFWSRPPNLGAIGDGVHAGPVGVGRRRDRAQSAVGRRARARLDDGDQPGDAAAASGCDARLLRVLRRAVRERRAAGADRRARARRGAHAEDAGAERRVGDPRRDGVRAPRLRHRPGDPARALRRRDGEHPVVGARDDAVRRRHRRRSLRVRVHLGAPSSPGDGDRGARPGEAAPDDGAARARRHALAVRRGRRDLLPDPRLDRSSSSRCGRRCARSTSTRRCPPPASCCC